MKVFVKAKTGAKKESVEKLDSKDDWKADYFLVSVKERPIKGAANAAIIKALAKHFNVPPSRIKNISGATSKWKTFEI